MSLLLVNLACLLGISTWSPPKSLAWQKGFRLGSGLTLVRLGPLLLVCNLVLLVSVVGMRLVVTGGTLWLGVPLLLLHFFLARFVLIGGLLLTWLFMLFLIMVGGMLGLLSPFVVLLFGLPLGCLLLIRLGVLGQLRFRGFGRFMMSGFSLCLGVMLFCLSLYGLDCLVESCRVCTC